MKREKSGVGAVYLELCSFVQNSGAGDSGIEGAEDYSSSSLRLVNNRGGNLGELLP
jgi:hypothetical protein